MYNILTSIKEAYEEGEEGKEQTMKKTEEKGGTRKGSITDDIAEEGEEKRLY